MGGDEFGDDLRRELERGAYASGGNTISGTVRGAEGGVPEADSFHLRVSISSVADDGESAVGSILDTLLPTRSSDGDPAVQFSERMQMPHHDADLRHSKFGRILRDAGYDRTTASRIVGETVECRYEGDGDWAVVDPLNRDAYLNVDADGEADGGTGEVNDDRNASSPLSMSSIPRPSIPPVVAQHSPSILLCAWILAVLAVGFTSTPPMRVLSLAVVAFSLVLWFGDEFPTDDPRSLGRWLLGRSDSARRGGGQKGSHSADPPVVTVYDGDGDTDVTVEEGAGQVSVRIVDGTDGRRVTGPSGSTRPARGTRRDRRSNSEDERSRDRFDGD